MKLEEIIQSVSVMSDEEITARLREIRKSRTIVKEVTPTKRPTVTKEKKVDDISTVLKSLSPAEITALKAMLGGA